MHTPWGWSAFAFAATAWQTSRDGDARDGQRGGLAQTKLAQTKLAEGERSLAEGEGFEPPIPFRVQRFSRPPPSTTRPSLRRWARFDRTRWPGFSSFRLVAATASG